MLRAWRYDCCTGGSGIVCGGLPLRSQRIGGNQLLFSFCRIGKREGTRGNRGCLAESQCKLSTTPSFPAFSFAVDRQGGSSVPVIHAVDPAPARRSTAGML